MHIAQLRNIAKTLEVFGVYEGKQGIGDVDISPYRVANGFALVF